VESEGKTSHPFLPDVSVTTPQRRKKSSRSGAVAVAEPDDNGAPLTLRAFIEEEHRETFIEVYETSPEQRLITCVEVLSPSNKRPGSTGRELYQRKRQSLLLGNVNLVEIDLLRGGERMPMLDPWPASPYVLMVAKARKAQLCQVWPAHFQTPLPRLPVPLAKPDPAIVLDLQAMVEGIYRRYRYERSIDYSQALIPPLSADEATWLQQRLRAQARRQKQ
jgi:hypothetical protein